MSGATAERRVDVSGPEFWDFWNQAFRSNTWSLRDATCARGVSPVFRALVDRFVQVTIDLRRAEDVWDVHAIVSHACVVRVPCEVHHWSLPHRDASHHFPDAWVVSFSTPCKLIRGRTDFACGCRRRDA